jgi:hypothetical protein
VELVGSRKSEALYRRARSACSGALTVRRFILALGFIALLELLMLETLPLSTYVAAVAPHAEIVSHSAWQDPLDPFIFHIFGEVRNTCGNWIRDVRVIAYLYEVHEDLRMPIQTVSSPALASFLSPGSVAPFDIVIEGFSLSDTVYMLMIESLTILQEPIPLQLTITGATHTMNRQGMFEATGKVANEGNVISRQTRVVGTFYDAAGRVIYAQAALVAPKDISPDTGSNEFRLMVADEVLSRMVAGFALIAEGEESSSVPQTSMSGVFQPFKKEDSSISIFASPESLMVGENVTIKGQIFPPCQARLLLRYAEPSGRTLTANLTSRNDGTYDYTFKVDAPGSWIFSVLWYGDMGHSGVESESVTIMVRPRLSLLTELLSRLGHIQEVLLNTVAMILLVVLSMALVLGFVVVRRKKPFW